MDPSRQPHQPPNGRVDERNECQDVHEDLHTKSDHVGDDRERVGGASRALMGKSVRDSTLVRESIVLESDEDRIHNQDDCRANSVDDHPAAVEAAEVAARHRHKPTEAAPSNIEPEAVHLVSIHGHLK